MTTPGPWTAERVVTPVDVQELLGRIAPELARLPVVPLAEGWDNAVFLVGTDRTLRLPRRAVALAGVRREIAVLPVIAPLLPLAVPAPELVAVDGRADPWPVTVSRLVPGRELAEAALPAAARGPAATAVGAFLRTLHAASTLDAVRASGTEPAVDPMDRGWPRARRTQVEETLARLVGDGVWAGDPEVARLLDRAARLEAPGGTPVLVHGDLHVRHLLVDDGGAATGVIDWGDLCVADPAVDLALAYSAFEGAPRAAFLAAYGTVGEETELRARALAVRLSALLADYAARDGRPVLLGEALAGLRRAVR